MDLTSMVVQDLAQRCGIHTVAIDDEGFYGFSRFQRSNPPEDNSVRICNPITGFSGICKVRDLIGEPGRLVRAVVQIFDEGVHGEALGIPVELIDYGRGV